MGSRGETTWSWLPAVALVAATVATLAPSLHSAVLDADLALAPGPTTDQPGPRDLGRLLADMRGGGFQPLTWAWLRVDYAAWGTKPHGYHAVNLAVHVANVLLVYLLGLRLFGLARQNAIQHVAAFLAALLFALHPLRVEPVTWAVQRGVLLATLFALLTVLFYMRACAGRRTSWAAAFLCFAASLASGPWAAGLPLVLLALDVYPLQRRGVVRILVEKTALAGLACAAIIAGLPAASPGFLTRLVLAGYGFFFYLWRTLWPVGLLPIYELPEAVKLSAPHYVAAAGGVVAVLAVVACYARRVPALAVAVSSYLVLLLPAVLMLQCPSEQAGDRYSYLASVPCMLVLGAGLARLWSLPGQRTAAVTCLVLGLVAAGALGALAWRQARIWRTPATLWGRADELAPHSALVSFRLGQLAERAGEYERAVQFYRSAAGTRPGAVTFQLALGQALMHELNFQDATAAYRRALKLEPRSAETHLQLGLVLAASGDFEPAEQELKQAVALAPTDVRPRKALGHLYMLLRRFPEAVQAFRDAGALAPHDADLRYHVDRAYRAATSAPTTTTPAAPQ